VRVEKGRCGGLGERSCTVVGVDVLDGVRGAGGDEAEVDRWWVLGGWGMSRGVVGWWCASLESVGLLRLLLVMLVLTFMVGGTGAA